MKEIITISKSIIGTDEKNAVNARDLHMNLEINKKFSDWTKLQISALGLEKNIDYIVFPLKGKNPKGGRTSMEYIITLDAAKHIAMASRTEKGKEVRQYFIQAEKKLKKVNNFDENLLSKFMENQQQTNNIMIQLLEKLVNKDDANIKTLSSQQMDKIKGLIYLTAIPICEYFPLKTREETLKELYTGLNAQMGVLTYYHIPCSHFDEAVEIVSKCKLKWEKKCKQRDLEEKVSLGKEIKDLLIDI